MLDFCDWTGYNGADNTVRWLAESEGKMLASRADYKVGIYVRLSQEYARMGESVSIENQKSMLVKYCGEQGWRDHSIYCDDGYSGGNFVEVR